MISGRGSRDKSVDIGVNTGIGDIIGVRVIHAVRMRIERNSAALTC
jgi:hypothetical protein